MQLRVTHHVPLWSKSQYKIWSVRLEGSTNMPIKMAGHKRKDPEAFRFFHIVPLPLFILYGTFVMLYQKASILTEYALKQNY